MKVIFVIFVENVVYVEERINEKETLRGSGKEKSYSFLQLTVLLVGAHSPVQKRYKCTFPSLREYNWVSGGQNGGGLDHFLPGKQSEVANKLTDNIAKRKYLLLTCHTQIKKSCI